MTINYFWGPIPNLTRLRLQGQYQISQDFRHYNRLRLSNNQLNGSIPESLGQLPFLNNMDLSSNLFCGTITEAHFTNLSRLEFLDMSQNSVLKMNRNWISPFKLYSLVLNSGKVGPCFSSMASNTAGADRSWYVQSRYFRYNTQLAVGPIFF